MFLNCLWVGFGGMLGSIARYLVGLLPFLRSDGFPWATFAVNFIGAFLIGLFASFAEAFSVLGGRTGLFLRVGLCGGFTTFSTFSYETVSLIEQGRLGIAAGYVFISVSACLLGVWLGLLAGRFFGLHGGLFGWFAAKR